MSPTRHRGIFIAAAGIVVSLSCFMWSWNEVEGAATDRPHDSRKDKTDNAIGETKTKGFDGVDFSYDVFGAPPGQDPQKTAEDAMAKEIADKPQVLARQKKLLHDRYQLDCKTTSGVTMTKGKHQPIGPP